MSLAPRRPIGELCDAAPESFERAEIEQRQEPLPLTILRRLIEKGPSRALLCETLDRLGSVLDCERIFLVRLRSGGGFHVPVARNRDKENIGNAAERVSHFAIQRLLAEDDVVHVADARADRRYRPEEALQGKKVPISMIVFPLRGEDGLLGAIYTDTRLRSLEVEPARTEAAQLLVSAVELILKLREQEALLAQCRKARLGLPQVDSGVAEGVSEDVASFSASERARDLLNDCRKPEVFHGLLSLNPDLLDLFDTLRTLEHAELPVLILGETGTGKGVLARAVHACSARRDGPFLTLSCGTLPDELVESELLGHRKGAFTGAEADHDGLLAQADGGTLFLDDVEDMSPGLQTKLLRVLADGEVRPLGAKMARHVDVRIVVASRESLEDLVRRGRFRKDLYFRLRGAVVEIPPLSKRPEDVLPLTAHFLSCYRAGDEVPSPQIMEDAKLRLLSYGWPGNVRELEGEVRRLVALGLERVHAEDLQLLPLSAASLLSFSVPGGSGNLAEVVHFAEREAILEALRGASGNKSKAAKHLGITRKALYRRLAKYGIDI